MQPTQLPQPQPTPFSPPLIQPPSMQGATGLLKRAPLSRGTCGARTLASRLDSNEMPLQVCQLPSFVYTSPALAHCTPPPPPPPPPSPPPPPPAPSLPASVTGPKGFLSLSQWQILPILDLSKQGTPGMLIQGVMMDCLLKTLVTAVPHGAVQILILVTTLLSG